MEGENRRKTEIPSLEGLNGIRATLNSYGYNNEDIGFDDKTGTVTLYGKNFMKPEIYDSDNGITYASENSIRSNLKSFDYEPLKEVTPYYSAFAGNNNLPFNAIGYSDGNITIGGTEIPYAYIDENNKAWAKQSDLDKAFNEYRQSSGVKSNSEIFDKYNSLYGDEINKVLNRIKNRGEFSYNVEDDPVYKAYKAMYEREGNRSAEDTLAAYSAQTGGYANSAAVTAAAAARQYYSEKLNDVIPELEAQAYNRYIADLENDFNTLESLKNLFSDMFNMEYKANRDTAEDIYRAANDDIERDRYSEKNNREKRASDLEYELGVQELNSNYMFDEQNYRIGEQKLKQGELNYQLGEQELKQGKLDYLLGEQELKKGELDIQKSQQDLRKGEMDLKKDAMSLSQTAQKIRKGEIDIQQSQMNLISTSIKQEILQQQKELNRLKIENYDK